MFWQLNVLSWKHDHPWLLGQTDHMAQPNFREARKCDPSSVQELRENEPLPNTTGFNKKCHEFYIKRNFEEAGKQDFPQFFCQPKTALKKWSLRENAKILKCIINYW